jgi:ABC-2 type transport system permease protein
VNLAKTFFTASRVLKQLMHDPRTLALLFVVPSLLIALLKYVYIGQPAVFNGIAPMLLGIFPMVMMFLITSIATLRERRSGTLDRLMTMPISKLDFILGYALAFSAIAFVQAVVTSIVMLGILDVPVMGGTAPTILVAIVAAFLGTSLGLFSSAFATSEFQAVQFMPALLLPQVLLCGLLIDRQQMGDVLQWISNVMPLTYSVEAIKEVVSNPTWTSALTKDLVIVLGFAIVALVLGSVTIRRQEKP